MLERADTPAATVVSLHVHGDASGVAMIRQDELRLVAGKGVIQSGVVRVGDVITVGQQPGAA